MKAFFFLHGTVDQCKFSMHQLVLYLPAEKNRKWLTSEASPYFSCCFFLCGSFKPISNGVKKSHICKTSRIQIRVGWLFGFF